MVGHSAFSAPFFHDIDAAYAKLESILWPHGPVCPRCGSLDRIRNVRGKTARPGLRRCGACKRQFTVTVGTVFESSHVPLNLWLQAAHLMCSSKKGMSSHQIHRILGVQYNTAWFMAMRLREAMREGRFPEALGGQNKVVEADETYIGGKEHDSKSKRQHHDQGGKGKEAAFSLIERDGRVRSFHLPQVNAATLKRILHTQIDTGSYLMTDDAAVYDKLGRVFSGHDTVNHSIEEYVHRMVDSRTPTQLKIIFRSLSAA